MDKRTWTACEMRHISAWFMYLSGCVLNDSTLTQVEGYSRMRNGERQAETGEEGEIERRVLG